MDADHNADMCLFLEQWEEMREDMRSYNCSPAALHSWQEQTLAYYAGASVECVEPEELDEDERLARRRAYLEKEFGLSLIHIYQSPLLQIPQEFIS